MAKENLDNLVNRVWKIIVRKVENRPRHYEADIRLDYTGRDDIFEQLSIDYSYSSSLGCVVHMTNVVSKKLILKAKKRKSIDLEPEINFSISYIKEGPSIYERVGGKPSIYGKEKKVSVGASASELNRQIFEQLLKPYENILKTLPEKSDIFLGYKNPISSFREELLQREINK